MMYKAMFWEEGEGDKVKCKLCPNACLVAEGKRGICGVRENRGGKLYSLIYARTSSIAPDPIEKKPLYHFYPGTTVLSFGTIGCNFRCLHCQNYSISQAKFESSPLREISAEQMLDLASRYGCKGVAWTYNEPIIWYEFTYECSRAAKENGLYTVYVTNGFINPQPLRKLAPYLDAMNVDTKSMSEEHYRKICNGRLEPVLSTVKLAKELGIHLELTYLVVPEHNDSPAEIKKYCNWVATQVGKDTPVHFSRFYPHYKMNYLPPTPMRTLAQAYELAKEHLEHVYLGNVPHGEYENTYCSECGALLLERYGFSVEQNLLQNKKCPACGKEINIITM